MDSLVYSLNATVPVFLIMVIGYALKKAGMLNESFVNVCNRFNFMVTLPVLLFKDISSTDILHGFDLKYVLFCIGATSAAFWGIWGLSELLIKDKTIIGAFVQACYRSSAAVLGTAFIMNIYGNVGMTPLMIIGSVPLFNVYAVIVLTFGADRDKPPENKKNTEAIKRSALGIIKNPIIISIFAGIISSLLGIKYPVIIDKTLSSLAALASPLALIAIGAGFEFSAAKEKVAPATAAAFIKLLVLPAVFLPIAVYLGFTAEKLAALIIMLGSPTTPSSYIMAKNMKNDGVLTSCTIMLTTLFSALTLTLWIFLARYMGLM